MMTDIATGDEALFYAQGGERKGPVPAETLRELLAAQTIDGDTSVWRKGLTDWQPLRTTEIGGQLLDLPPPIATKDVNNGFVWTLAFAPLAYLLVDTALLNYQNSQPAGDQFFEAFLSPLSWLVPVLTNAILCLIDTEQLKRAGYSSGWLTLFALLLAPVYLFVRAKRLHQTPTYGFVWIASFVLTTILRRRNMQTGPQTDDLIFLAFFFVTIGLVYIAPSIVAFYRNHPNRWIIFVLNIAFGGTIIGWGIALVWAFRAAHRVGSTSSGGESGLNLFINDVKRIQLVDPPPLPATSPVQELERLHELLVRGAISQGEFDGLKAKLLGSASSR